jgi:hypothetical protein
MIGTFAIGVDADHAAITWPLESSAPGLHNACFAVSAQRLCRNVASFRSQTAGFCYVPIWRMSFKIGTVRRVTWGSAIESAEEHPHFMSQHEIRQTVDGRQAVLPFSTDDLANWTGEQCDELFRNSETLPIDILVEGTADVLNVSQQPVIRSWKLARAAGARVAVTKR